MRASAVDVTDLEMLCEMSVRSLQVHAVPPQLSDIMLYTIIGSNMVNGLPFVGQVSWDLEQICVGDCAKWFSVLSGHTYWESTRG